MKHDRYETLLAFCKAAEWAQEPEIVYQRFVDVSVEYLGCAAAHMHMLDSSGTAFVHSASHDPETDRDFYSQSITFGIGRLASLLENREPIVMEDYERPHELDEIPTEAIRAGYKSAVSIPLSASSGVIGMLSIVYDTQLPWKTDEDLAFLLELGSVLGIFIERMQMQKKELVLNVLKERKRLSSEIHDSISQMASALALRADIAQECFEEDDRASLQQELRYLSDHLRQMTKILREEMLSLRTPLDEVGSVTKIVEDAFARFQQVWDIESHLHVPDEDILLSGAAQLNVARIVNEALLNVMRHSKAKTVDVRVLRKNGDATIVIADDGIGFEMKHVAPERLGIRIMRERAESVGGSLEIVSDGGGTTVRVLIPAADS